MRKWLQQRQATGSGARTTVYCLEIRVAPDGTRWTLTDITPGRRKLLGTFKTARAAKAAAP